MADTMMFALVGSLIVTLTLLPVLCAWFMRKGVRERRNAVFEAIKSVYIKGLDFCLAHPWGTTFASALLLGGVAAADPVHRRRVHAATGRRRAVGARDDALHDLVRRIGEDRAEGARRSCARSRKSPRSPPNSAGRTTAPTPTGFFNVEFYVGLKPYSQWTGAYRTKAELIAAINKKLAGVSRHHLQLHAAGGRRGGRGGDRL